MVVKNKMKKLESILPEEMRNGLAQGQIDELKNTIVQCLGNIKQAKDELEENEQYQDLKESLKALSEGFREVKKFQNAKIEYCMVLIGERQESSKE